MPEERKLRVVLVGEDNPQSTDPRAALWDDPPGCAGARLRDILGLDRRTYRRVTRVNLCNPTWNGRAARKEAGRLLKEHKDDLLVLLGRRVGNAFGLTGWPLMRLGSIWTFDGRATLPGSVQVALLPHPSGLNLLWNDPRAVQDARYLLREAGADLPVPEPAEDAPSDLDMLRRYLAGGR